MSDRNALGRLGEFSIKRRRPVLLIGLMLVVVAGIFGTAIFENVDTGGFDDETSESWKGAEALAEQFKQQDPNLVLVVDAKGRSINDQEAFSQGSDLTRRLSAEKQVVDVVSYFNTQSPALKSSDGTKALIVARLTDEDDRPSEIAATYASDSPNLKVMVGGEAILFSDITDQIGKDLARAEMISLPIILVMLVVVFGGLIAASVPLLVGIFSIITTLLILRLLALVTDISVYSINLTTMLGLGLGIDYSLFILTRYREEVRKGFERNQAIITAVKTSGRTVLFSALIVGCSLAAMLVFPLYFLKSFAYAGIAVVAMAAFSSLVIVPAVLAALGPRIDKFAILKDRHPEDGSEFWATTARKVMRKPITITVATIGFLVFLGYPFLNATWGSSDDRVLPAEARAHQTGDVLRKDFSSNESSPLTVISEPLDNPTALFPQIDTYATQLSGLSGVARVDAPTGSYANGQKLELQAVDLTKLSTNKAVRLEVIPNVEPISPEGEALVADVHSVDSPFPKMVTGNTATSSDNKRPIAENLYKAGAIIALSTLIIFFLMTGSVILPIKALMLSILSLAATFGAMVWIFQDGNLSGFLNFTPTGTLDSTNPVIIFCIAFGLSMDYEVFLISRIKEEHERTFDTEKAVAFGLKHTGRLVTAAALLIAVVFLSFATSDVAFIKLIGVGLALAVIMDATIIRGLLVPAFMKLMGGLNWWAPRPLKALHQRFGLGE